ncbi:MAG: PKD domain-containing protein, partial [Bacteroidota bacterium]
MCLLMLFGPWSLAMAQVLTDFEDGLDGWTAVGDGQFYLEEDTGNPGSTMRIDDDATGNILYAIAPGHFLGDWSQTTPQDSLYYDLFLNRISGSFLSTSRIFSISGPGGRAWGLLGSEYNAIDQEWRRYAISLDPDDWVMQSGTWEDLIQNVTLFELTAEFINGPEFVRLDNIGMTFSPQITSASTDIRSTFDHGGFEGWYFVDAGPASVQNSGGNPDGYVRIGDRSGVISRAIAPPYFLGDWTGLDGSAALNFDINILNHSGSVLDLDYFVRISGPADTARVALPADITESFGQWKTFSFFLSEDDWIMESGSWDNLMQNVTELIITVEFISGSETIGLDNVMFTDDPPEVDFTASPTFLFPGDSTQFTDQSRFAPSEWLWDFGDGNTSTESSPWHTYESAGVFDVSLEATNRFGTNTLVKESLVEVAGISDSLLFLDEFTGSPIHPGWSFRGNCNWSIQNETLAQTSNYHVAGNLLGACFGITGSRYWDDYLLDVDFRSTDDDGIGAIFRYQDENNFYLFYWREEVEHRALKKFVDGEEIDLAADTAKYDVDRWYNLKIEANGPEITVWLDDEILYEVTDSTFEAGKAGVYCWANQSSYWDNFKVVRTNMEPDPSSITFANLENGTATVEEQLGEAWVYAQVEIPGVTDAAGSSEDLQAWIGYSQQDGDPAELQDVEWEEAQFDSDYEDLGSGRHRYMFDMGSTIQYIGKKAPSSNGIQSEQDPF